MQRGILAPRPISGRTLCLCSLLLLGLLPAAARADGISLRHLKLPELINQAKVALLVTVTAKEGPKGFSAKVKRVWHRGASPVWSVGVEDTFAREQEPPATRGKWVIVERYWDNLSSSVTPGQELILVPMFNSKGAPIRALIKKTPHAIYKLELLFKDKWRRAYRKGATARALERDLADYDLFEEAHGVLLRGGRLKNRVVIQAATRARNFDLVAYHLGKIRPHERARFIRALVHHLKKHPAEQLSRRLRQHFDRGKLQRDEIPALVLYLHHLLDQTQKQNLSKLYHLNYTILRYLKEPRGKRDAPRFISYFARYAPLRPHAGGAAEHITTYVELLAPRDGPRLALALMKGPMKTAKGQLDYFSLKLALDLSAKLPPAKLLAFLKKIHPQVAPTSFDGCEQVNVMVRSVILLARTRPKMRKQLIALAKQLYPQYNCNVDQPTKEQLGELARIGP